MAEESFQERTEPATPKRREESRKKGQVARSTELNSVAIIGAGLLGILLLGETLLIHISRFTTEILGQSYMFTVSTASAPLFIWGWGEFLFKVMTPFFLIILVTGLAINVVQVGFFTSAEPLAPKLNRLSPISGVKRLFSKRALVEAAKGLFKIGIVGYILYFELTKGFDDLLSMSESGLGRILGLIGGFTFSLGLKVALFLAVLAILDFVYQRWEFEKSIRMTKQQVKEELRQTEGDPQVRARIRALQRENARKRMLAEVPEADVVVTNPTHFAVALRYDTDTMTAPTLVAKGQNLIAQKIREFAEEAGVPVVENPPLAQALYKAVDVGQEIPENLYRAVAEVLAYVFKLKRNKA